MVVQLTAKLPIVFDVVYDPLSGPNPVFGDAFTSLMKQKKKAFDQRFEEVFQLEKKVCPQ